MSYDLQLAFPCPHIIGEEPVLLGADRRTLTTLKPIAGVGVVQLWANGTLSVPPTGLRCGAVLQGARPEPYHITPGNTQLTLHTQRHRYAYTLTPGYYSVAQMVAQINSITAGRIVASAAADHYLRLEETEDPGTQSRLRVEGTARNVLGYEHQWGATGRGVLPGWHLYTRPDEGPGSMGGYRLVFAAPVVAAYRFTLSYSVASELCLRCRSTGVENDFRTDSSGEVLRVTGADLLYQSCLKVLLTELRSNLYYPWYGSNLVASVGTKGGPGTAAALRAATQTALRNFQALQTAQARYQRVTAAERLFSVDGVEVLQSDADPTVFLVEVEVRNYASTPVRLTIVYTTPGTLALPGTNGLSLGVPR